MINHPRLMVFSLTAAFCLLFVSLASCQQQHTVTLALLGDLMLGRGVDPTPDSLAYLKADLSSADLALANLESPLANILPAADSTYNLCAPSNRAELLPLWGFDLVSLANNHRFDCAPNGPAETRSKLGAVGISSIGPGMEPVLRELKGLKLAFLNFDDISSQLNENAAVQAVRAARATGALVVVSVHWGLEYQEGSSDRQRSLAHQFADAGAVLIWGHHPHVLQPAEWIQPPAESKPARNSTLVLYSLGNALFDQGGLDDTRRSALVMVKLDAGGVISVQVIPFEIDIIHSRVFKPDAGTAEKILNRLSLP